MSRHSPKPPAARRKGCLAVLLILGSAAGLDAGTTPETVQASEPAVIPPAPSPWEFTVTPYGWLAGIDSDLAVNGFQTSTSFGVDDILRNLDMIAMFNVEVRRGRFGGWVDGIYLDVSSGGDSPGDLLESIDVSIESIIAEAALFYRFWETDRGFLDIYGGVRYMRLSSDLGLNVSDSGVRELSQELSAKMFDELRSSLREGTAPARQAAKNSAASKAQNELARLIDARVDEVESKLNDLRQIAASHPRLVEAIRNSDRLREAIREAAAAEASQRIAAAQEKAANAAGAAASVRQAAAAAKARAERAVTRAEQKLAKAIERELKDSIPSEISGSASWVDPFVGLRARYNLSDRFYAVGKADIGGFGVGSELVWQAYCGLGYELSRNVATELGYRHFSLDYSGSSDLVADMQMSGIVLSLVVRF